MTEKRYLVKFLNKAGQEEYKLVGDLDKTSKGTIEFNVPGTILSIQPYL